MKKWGLQAKEYKHIASVKDPNIHWFEGAGKFTKVDALDDRLVMFDTRLTNFKCFFFKGDFEC